MSKESIKEIDSRLKMAEDADWHTFRYNPALKAEGKAACRKRAPCENASVRRKIC